MNKDFLEIISKDSEFLDLNSPEQKIALYKKNGAIIGKNVKLGYKTRIIADHIEIGDDTIIGDNCYIKAEKLKIGRMAAIGDNVNIVTRFVEIGDVFFTGNNILIGGGGAFGQNSGIEIGDSCLVSSDCIINTSEKVTIGNEVGLSPRVQIYTHSHWQNVLEGYFATFSSVTIGDHSYITGNCLITPGTNIGKGCTILANSLVIGNISDYTVAVGVPAKKIREVRRNLSPERKDRIMQKLMVELKKLLKFKGFDPEDVIYSSSYGFSYGSYWASKPVVLALEIKGTPKNPKNVVVFDLTNYVITGKQTPLSDEVRNFLRKRGIRFKPILWRYTADKGLYKQ